MTFRPVGPIVIAALLLVTAGAFAHSPAQPPHQRYHVGDFTLESGAVIQDFSVSYVTHGTLNDAKSNALLVLPSRDHHGLDALIGPGRTFDTARFFVVVVDSIGNGLTTSPSTSVRQPRMLFPKFNVRDMVASQHKLLTEHLGIEHVVAVAGASLGSLQALQWSVSHPNFMTGLIAIQPLAKTPPWTRMALEVTRKAIMLDPAWNKGDYAKQPDDGLRLFHGIGTLLLNTPETFRDIFTGKDLGAWAWEAASMELGSVDANNLIYRSWAYEQHDVSATPGMDDDLVTALRAITAKCLILVSPKDLMNPAYEPTEAARFIRDVRVVEINPNAAHGHAAGANFFPADSEDIARHVTAFMDVLSPAGRRR